MKHRINTAFKDNSNLAEMFIKEASKRNEEGNMSLAEIKMKYEVARLKAKLAVVSDVVTRIERKLLNVDSMEKSEIKVIRNELRDLNDFIKEV